MLLQDQLHQLWFQPELFTLVQCSRHHRHLSKHFLGIFVASSHNDTESSSAVASMYRWGSSGDKTETSFAVVWGHCHLTGSLWTDCTCVALGPLTGQWSCGVSPQWFSTEQSLRLSDSGERGLGSYGFSCLSRVFELQEDFFFYFSPIFYLN